MPSAAAEWGKNMKESNFTDYVAENLGNIYGSMVFNDSVMREKLPKAVYQSLKRTIDEGKDLDPSISDVVASAMKDWAVEKGATHFCHWFIPMTGLTAEKHDSFISPTREGKIIMEFSGKNLIKGEPDASSFPSGGLRATFEARGYTAWDCTSPAFVKDNTLCIPTAFCSYNGEALDKKTPLLRSLDLLSAKAVKLLHILGKTDVKHVSVSVGAEQEYFLVDKNLYRQRLDLILTGRTLFGAMPPKGQELDDHYFGNLKPKVSEYMKELDYELWRLGVSAKTKHNEVAPCQHELAPVFSVANVATDHNHLTMEIMKKVADRHNLVCLLHEKPFAGVNGSGKHNNWSMTTDTGENLLDPGDNPTGNMQFLLFLSSVIKAVDEYADLLRCSVASAGNDHRLGANEAPPAIISIFLGDFLSAVLKNAVTGKKRDISTGELSFLSSALPTLTLDSSDRNRTSPFAFTGNKFEFRMLGSSASIADANIVLNTIVAHVLSEFADRLEKSPSIEAGISEIIGDVLQNNFRIVFNGDGYSEEWVKEAERRGLPNIKNTVDTCASLISEKSIRLFTETGVFSKSELYARYEIALESYIKVINVEALTALDMAERAILPAVTKYLSVLSEEYKKSKDTELGLDLSCLSNRIRFMAKKIHQLDELIEVLRTSIAAAKSKHEDCQEQAKLYRDTVVPIMHELRHTADTLETITAKEYWPFPTYSDLFYTV